MKDKHGRYTSGHNRICACGRPFHSNGPDDWRCIHCCGIGAEFPHTATVWTTSPPIVRRNGR